MTANSHLSRVTVTLDADELKALLSFVPVNKLTYTPAGERAYGAYQDLQHALDGPMTTAEIVARAHAERPDLAGKDCECPTCKAKAS